VEIYFFERWQKWERKKLFCNLELCVGYSGLQMCFFLCGGYLFIFLFNVAPDKYIFAVSKILNADGNFIFAVSGFRNRFANIINAVGKNIIAVSNIINDVASIILSPCKILVFLDNFKI